MKKLIVIFSLVVGSASAQTTYEVFNNGELFPSQTIETTPQGEIKVYDRDSFNPAVPVQTIVPTQSGYNVYDHRTPQGSLFPSQQIIIRENKFNSSWGNSWMEK